MEPHALGGRTCSDSGRPTSSAGEPRSELRRKDTIRRALWQSLRSLALERSGSRRQDARPELTELYRVSPEQAWWRAVGAPPERGARPHCAGTEGLDCPQSVRARQVLGVARL
jgi:hypothetical protein